MELGYYWLTTEGCEPEVVQTDDDTMYFCGSDVSAHFKNGQLVGPFDEVIEVVSIDGPIVTPNAGGKAT